LFCYGKLPVKHGLWSLCYPIGVVTLLLLLVLGLLVVISVDVGQKRHAFLCQQEDARNRS